MLSSIWLFALALGVFLALNALDVHSTWLVIRYSSPRAERNPLARILIGKLGVLPGLLTLKGVIALILPLIILWRDEAPLEMNLILLGSCLAYSIVVANNYRIWRRLKRRRRPVG